MKFSLLTIIFMSFPAFAQTSPRIFEFTDSYGYTYLIDLERIRPGYSAGLIERGMLAGQIQKPNNPTGHSMPNDIADFFAYQIADNNYNNGHLERAKNNFLKGKLVQATKVGSTLPTAAATVPLAPAATLDWKSFEDCARRNLPFLREAIALKSKMTTDAQAQGNYYLVKSILGEVTSNKGLVCGAFLRPDLVIRITDEVLNVKILATLLKRTSDDRKELLSTLIAAFSEKSPDEIKLLYTYYFSRQYFTGALSNKPLPSYEELNRDLAQYPQVYETPIQFPLGSMKIQMVLQVNDSESLMLKGRNFLKEVGL